MGYEPQTVKIKHGSFWYNTNTTQINASGKEEEIIVQRVAFQNEELEIPHEADYERGVQYDAFFNEGERLDPLTGELLFGAPDTDIETDIEGEEPTVGSLSHDELVDWLMATGDFDGKKKPSVPEVIEAVGDDKELAARVLEAEKEASGANPRGTLVEALEA